VRTTGGPGAAQADAAAHGKDQMATVTFVCPMTELSVQHWLEDGKDLSEDEHIVRCPACVKLHLINRKTGKLLAVVDDQRSRANRAPGLAKIIAAVVRSTGSR
jgi:hypothetical protein